jgi:hypothetical protein
MHAAAAKKRRPMACRYKEISNPPYGPEPVGRKLSGIEADEVWSDLREEFPAADSSCPFAAQKHAMSRTPVSQVFWPERIILEKEIDHGIDPVVLPIFPETAYRFRNQLLNPPLS